MRISQIVIYFIFFASLILNGYFIKTIYFDDSNKAQELKDDFIAKSSNQSKKVISSDTFDVKPSFRTESLVEPKMTNSVASVKSQVSLNQKTDTIHKYYFIRDTIYKDSVKYSLNFTDSYSDLSFSYDFKYEIPITVSDSIKIDKVISKKKSFNIDLEYGFVRINDTLFVWAYENSPAISVNNLNGYYTLESPKQSNNFLNLGASAGLAYAPFSNKFFPYVGIGVNFSIIPIDFVK